MYLPNTSCFVLIESQGNIAHQQARIKMTECKDLMNSIFAALAHQRDLHLQPDQSGILKAKEPSPNTLINGQEPTKSNFGTLKAYYQHAAYKSKFLWRSSCERRQNMAFEIELSNASMEEVKKQHALHISRLKEHNDHKLRITQRIFKAQQEMTSKMAHRFELPCLRHIKNKWTCWLFWIERSGKLCKRLVRLKAVQAGIIRLIQKCEKILKDAEVEYNTQEWPSRLQAPLQKRKAHVPFRPRWKGGRRYWIGLKPEDVIQVERGFGFGYPLLVDRTAFVVGVEEPVVGDCEKRAEEWAIACGKLTSWEDDSKRRSAIVI